MWALATARIAGRAMPCLRVNGQLYPFVALDPHLPASMIDLFADWPAAEALRQHAGAEPAPLEREKPEREKIDVEMFSRLSAEVADLRKDVADLKQQFAAFRKQFE